MESQVKKEIVELAKKEGLDLVEDMAANAVRTAFAILRALAPRLKGESSLIVLPIIAAIEPILMRLVDKIDGEDDPEY